MEIVKNYKTTAQAVIWHINKRKNAYLADYVLEALEDKKVLKEVNRNLPFKEQLFGIHEVYLAPVAKPIYKGKNVFGEVERYVFVLVKSAPSQFNTYVGTYYVLKTDEKIEAKTDFKFAKPNEYVVIPDHLTPLTKLIDKKTQEIYEYLTRAQIIEFEDKYIAKANKPERTF